jgi:predicted RNase H-like nuclease
MRQVGVDDGGWMACGAGRALALRQAPEFLVCKTFTNLLTTTAACDMVTVDMPIGLPDGPAPRSCDIEA